MSNMSNHALVATIWVSQRKLDETWQNWVTVDRINSFWEYDMSLKHEQRPPSPLWDEVVHLCADVNVFCFIFNMYKPVGLLIGGNINRQRIFTPSANRVRCYLQ